MVSISSTSGATTVSGLGAVTAPWEKSKFDYLIELKKRYREIKSSVILLQFWLIIYFSFVICLELIEISHIF